MGGFNQPPTIVRNQLHQHLTRGEAWDLDHGSGMSWGWFWTSPGEGTMGSHRTLQGSPADFGRENPIIYMVLIHFEVGVFGIPSINSNISPF